MQNQDTIAESDTFSVSEDEPTEGVGLKAEQIDLREKPVLLSSSQVQGNGSAQATEHEATEDSQSLQPEAVDLREPTVEDTPEKIQKDKD